jgi:hypothetical protein
MELVRGVLRFLLDLVDGLPLPIRFAVVAAVVALFIHRVLLPVTAWLLRSMPSVVERGAAFVLWLEHLVLRWRRRRGRRPGSLVQGLESALQGATVGIQRLGARSAKGLIGLRRPLARVLLWTIVIVTAAGFARPHLSDGFNQVNATIDSASMRWCAAEQWVRTRSSKATRRLVVPNARTTVQKSIRTVECRRPASPKPKPRAKKPARR